MPTHKRSLPSIETINSDMVMSSQNIRSTMSDTVEHGQTTLNSVELRHTELNGVEKEARLSFRIPKSKRESLERYGESKGMDLSNLLRSILYEFMEKNHIGGK